MAGLLSEKKKGFDWGDAAMGFFGVPIGQIRSRKRKDRLAEAEAKAEAEQIRISDAAIEADPNLPTPEAKAWARMNRKAYAQVMLSRFETRQFGPGGGSVMTPGTGGPQWQMAPSRMEYQGSVSDIGPAVPGQKATVTPQHEGTQWITPQPGTTAFGVNSFSGLPRTGAGTAAPGAPSLDAQPTVEEGHVYTPGPGGRANPANWAPVQGGAGSQTPRTFPF